MIYIIRHGQTELNNRSALQGRSDHPLNDSGLLQAENAGELLREHGIRFDRVYSSPLIRAVQTAEQILMKAGGQDSADDSGYSVPIRKDERLIEMDYGPYEGMDLQNPAPEVMAFFMDFAGTPAPEGMEQLGSVVKRLGEFLEEIHEEALRGNVLLSTHAIAMKGALEYLTPESRGSYWSKYIGNCDIFAAEVTESGYGVPHRITLQ